MLRIACIAIALLTCLAVLAPAQPPAPLSIFEDHADVGSVLHPGSVDYDAARHTYTVSGSGENMWFSADAFQFVWKKISGDVTLSADISFIGDGEEAHRKAVLTIRQNLDADSAYADVARHGDGLTSLQARDEKGVNTTEIQSAVKAPARVRIAKRGDYFYIWVAGAGEEFQFSGGGMRVPMRDPFYVGIGVCSHNKNVVERAVFSNVELTAGASKSRPKLYSTLETIPVKGDRRVVRVAPGRLSNPEWSSGDDIIFQSDSSPRTSTTLTGPVVTEKDLPSDGFLNFSPRLSPDGRNIVFLSTSGDRASIAEDRDIMLRILSTDDQEVRTLAKFVGGQGSAPAWSPDSRRIAFISYQRVPY